MRSLEQTKDRTDGAVNLLLDGVVRAVGKQLNGLAHGRDLL
jgi:hypothetical protein